MKNEKKTEKLMKLRKKIGKTCRVLSYCSMGFALRHIWLWNIGKSVSPNWFFEVFIFGMIMFAILGVHFEDEYGGI